MAVAGRGRADEASQSDDPSLARVDYRERVYLAMNFISEHAAEKPSLEEIAAAASFSPFHFHRIFKAVVGENVAEFARRLRLERAAGSLLAYPERDVTGIAYDSGFSSSQNFAKAFAKGFGLSPTAYRRARRGPEAREEGRMLGVALRELPPFKAATIRVIGMKPEACAAAFAELLGWAAGAAAEDGAAGATPGPGRILAAYWDNPEVTPIERCRADCCLLVSEGLHPAEPAFIQELGGGTWAFCRFETPAELIAAAWEESFRWLVASGYECRPQPCLEIYLEAPAGGASGTWAYEIAIPLLRE